MAVTLKIPKGSTMKKEDIALLQNAAFASRVKARREVVSKSKVDTGYYPEGEIHGFQLNSFKVVELRKKPGADKKPGAVYGDGYQCRFQINDTVHPGTGKTFIKTYRITVPDATKAAERKAQGKEDFNVDAGEIKQLCEAALPDAQKSEAQKEENWGEILLGIIEAKLQFDGKAWESERTDPKNGNKYRDQHLRVFGLLDEQQAPGTETEVTEPEGDSPPEEATEEVAEGVAEGVAEETVEEEVTDEEVVEEEAAEGEANIDVGSMLKVKHPKRGEIEAEVTALDEAAGTFKAKFKNEAGKFVVASFSSDAVIAVL